MHVYTTFVACCVLAVAALLRIMARNVRRYRASTMSRHTFVRDCVSNAGITLVAATPPLAWLSAQIGPAPPATVAGGAALAVFVVGVICILLGFGLLVQENRRARVRK